MPGHFLYFIRRALRNMRQSPFLCFASIATVAVALAILAFFAIVVLNVENLAESWSREIQVVAYLEKDPGDRELDTLLSKIRAYPEVESVLHVTRQQAMERFRQRLGDEGSLLDGVSADLLPSSLEITMKKGERTRAAADRVAEKLRANPSMGEVRFGAEWLERFEAFLALLRMAGALLGGFLLFAAFFIVSNTIKLTLYARRDELEVMSLVGGTSLFIKAPFLIEGAVQGILGALIALGASIAAFHLFLHKGLSFLLFATSGTGITFLPPSYQISILGLGMLLGLMGSLLSLRKLVRI